MEKCYLCGHRCGVRRSVQRGVCRIDDGLYVASVYRHKGEEPVLGGDGSVCNVFFAHCNMQCLYCQNYQISDNTAALAPWRTTVPDLSERVKHLLDAGCDTLGLVSPTPYVESAIALVERLHEDGYFPTVVYNTNGYDTVDALRSVEQYVDIYLPDYKYGSYGLAKHLSGVGDYPDVALEAIGEMLRQKGGGVECDGAGIARRGVIVRHMVLPGFVENSRAALINLSVEFGYDITLSLMAQYNPAHRGARLAPLDRRVSAEEYDAVLSLASELGFTHGWTQELVSALTYNPDFTKADPFAPR